jgi:hypothetical protein
MRQQQYTFELVWRQRPACNSILERGNLANPKPCFFELWDRSILEMMRSFVTFIWQLLIHRYIHAELQAKIFKIEGWTNSSVDRQEGERCSDSVVLWNKGVCMRGGNWCGGSKSSCEVHEASQKVAGTCRGIFGQFFRFFCILTHLEYRRYYSWVEETVNRCDSEPWLTAPRTVQYSGSWQSFGVLCSHV